MKRPVLPLAIGLILVLTPSLATAWSGETDLTPLSNKDVLAMVQRHLTEEAIINTIKTSPCTFDIFPPVLQDMKRRGVPDTVLQAMVEAPYGPALRAMSSKDDVGEQPIYHYADQLKLMGYIAPSAVRRNNRTPRQTTRSRPSRRRQ